MSATNIKQADPMKTKTGKTRLGPLGLKQLVTLLEKGTRPKNKSKIQNRMRAMEKMGYTLPQEPLTDTAAAVQ